MPNATLARETKTLAFQIKTTGVTIVDGQQFGQIEAYGAAFNNIDEGNDRILPGAFTRTIQNSKARAKARGKKYILKMLWQHDPNEVIGGWYDLSEDKEGLLAKGEINLATRRGAEYYALAMSGMMDEFSIIYDVMTGGAKYDKSGVRDLSELRLFSIDPVTFPMNDDPHTVSVKSMEQKSVCGDTSLPIGPRKDTWDGNAAKKQIFNYAQDGDSFDVSKLKKCFLQQDGDPQQKGSWDYPFVEIVSGSPQINVAGVIACANALNGARDADAGEDTAGMRKKVATIYGRINAKYPDDDALEPPWEDSGKARNRHMQQKTLLEHYNEEMAQDLLEDWQDVYICALTKAIFDAFTIGDQPASDISEALDNFKELVISKFVAQAVECGLSQFIADSGYSYNPASTTLQNGSDDGYSSYGWMSSNRSRSTKRGAAISASNQNNIDNHIASLHDMANKMLADMKAHTKAMHDAADGFAQTMAGSLSDNSQQDDDQDDQEGKQLATALRELKALRTR